MRRSRGKVARTFVRCTCLIVSTGTIPTIAAPRPLRALSDWGAPYVTPKYHVAGVRFLSDAGLEGRLRSCSYAPTPDHQDHAPMIDELRRIFADSERDGQVAMDYDCRVYYGRLA